MYVLACAPCFFLLAPKALKICWCFIVHVGYRPDSHFSFVLENPSVNLGWVENSIYAETFDSPLRTLLCWAINVKKSFIGGCQSSPGFVPNTLSIYACPEVSQKFDVEVYLYQEWFMPSSTSGTNLSSSPRLSLTCWPIFSLLWFPTNFGSHTLG